VTKRTVAAVRATLGPITALHWNVASGAAGDLFAADTDAVHSALDVAVPSLVAAVQAAYPDLKSEKGAVLITTGGLGMLDPRIDAMAVRSSMMGLAVANAANTSLPVCSWSGSGRTASMLAR
jgi:NAD(P)-dependent dehydrogenase (short-subunit alcohol dehydrogenase family)